MKNKAPLETFRELVDNYTSIGINVEQALKENITENNNTLKLPSEERVMQ